MELIKIKERCIGKGKKIETCDARDVYDFVFYEQEKKTAFNVWISRAINKYDFIEGRDFQSFMIESTGGRNPKDYAVTLDMAKELAMVAPTKNGKRIRKYFIDVEKRYREQQIKEQVEKQVARETGKIERRNLTDVIQENVKKEIWNKWAYKNITDLAYIIVLGMSARKYRKETGLKDKENLREHLNKDQLDNIKKIESVLKSFGEMELSYSLMKEMLTKTYVNDLRGYLK